MKELPYNLQHLTLDFSKNYLSEMDSDLKWLGEGIKYLPNNL